MNDTRFKELLNLHLDHRLSPEEADELESALRQSPNLRAKLRSYEIMQRGCAELFQRSAADAPAPDALVRALREAEERMQAKHERRAWVMGWGTWGSSAGVAALVALMVARVSQPSLVVEIPAGADSDLLASSTSPILGAQVTVASDASRTLQPRKILPEHLTLAALGIAPERAVEDSSLSRWQHDEEGNSRLASATLENVGWMPRGTMGEAANAAWGTSAVSTTSFSGRPISAWSGATGGSPFQTASFTFDR